MTHAQELRDNQEHSALLARLDALKGTDVTSVFAELIRVGLQELIEAEATEAVGAGRYERTDSRTNHRNGHRSKTISTTSGDVELEIPKLRAGFVLPLPGRTPPADRQGPARGDHRGLRARRLDPQCWTSSPRWA
ncbi:hypothetical protein GCM10023094_55850 [Rhodococcus olei]|uniref:Mutator family transposase n=1 Tax=Rhodococcus olei TaxID=2161675 RepID=A0ABP8PSP8_9NOCA